MQLSNLHFGHGWTSNFFDQACSLRTLIRHYNGPAMDSPRSRLEMGAHFPSVPCMIGTKFFGDMKGLRKHTQPKQGLTLKGHYKWVK